MEGNRLKIEIKCVKKGIKAKLLTYSNYNQDSYLFQLASNLLIVEGLEVIGKRVAISLIKVCKNKFQTL
ncbi:hypothetical protein NEOC65_001473 [Neochlamydia sp. AcF65]|nr:hypothetical protein [Neochlamydia sp. AcF65]MBS4170278.1 hypothetical protein [Neochlamydia sp. AcF95]